jgi:hypothetical protein
VALLSAGAPPGEYRVVAGLWDPDSGARLHVLGPDGSATAEDGVVLTETFTVRP